jgi:hypothetical protein
MERGSNVDFRFWNVDFGFKKESNLIELKILFVPFVYFVVKALFGLACLHRHIFLRVVSEPCQLFLESQFEETGGAVPLLTDNNLCKIPVFL